MVKVRKKSVADIEHQQGRLVAMAMRRGNLGRATQINRTANRYLENIYNTSRNNKLDRAMDGKTGDDYLNAFDKWHNAKYSRNVYTGISKSGVAT